MSFDVAFEIVIGIEAGFTADPNDKGNWTGGQVGVGKLKGTKYGISAAAYPTLDIANLTLEQAKGIYYEDYWLKAACDHLVDEAMAILVFDCAVNQGIDRAKSLSMRGGNPIDFQAERALHYASLPTFDRYGRGWMRRLFRGLLQSGAKV